MLELEFKKCAKKKIIFKKRFEANHKEFSSFIHYLERQLEKFDCPMKPQAEISVAAEEVFVNIVNYAYDTDMGTIDINIEFVEDERRFVLSFIDRGKPFDPLKKVDPDITQSAEDRPIGGLGILMVKKTMDDLTYSFENGCNILTLTKII
ncbi:MAG: ATP-binding protein [Oscillospiraceae bacterium]|nr:ATP-binding protein [Candidatus Ruminococcus equi]